MLKKIAGLVVILAGFARADNAGYIKTIGLITGDDGKRYSQVEHSVTGGYFGADGNRLWGVFYVLLGDDEIKNAFQYADLMKSLSDHSITLDAKTGYTTDQITGEWVPAVTS